MTFFKGHPLGFLHPVNIIKTLPNNEEKGLRASQLKKPAKPEKERVRGFKGSRGRVVLLESFFKSEKRKSQRIPNQINQRNHFEMKSKTFHLMLASLRRFAIEGLIFVAVSSAVCFVFYRRILDMLLETVHIKVY